MSRFKSCFVCKPAWNLVPSTCKLDKFQRPVLCALHESCYRLHKKSWQTDSPCYFEQECFDVKKGCDKSQRMLSGDAEAVQMRRMKEEHGEKQIESSLNEFQRKPDTQVINLRHELHNGRLSVAPVAKHNPCPFDGTHGMQTRQTCLCCCFFFRQVVRRHLPMRAYLVQFQFRSSSMNPCFFTSNETCRCVPDGIRCVTLPLPALPRGTVVQHVSPCVTSTLLNVRISCRFRCTW